MLSKCEIGMLHGSAHCVLQHLYIEECTSRAQKRRSGEWRSAREMLSLMRGAGVVAVEVVRTLDMLFGITLEGRSVVLQFFTSVKEIVFVGIHQRLIELTRL